MIFSSQRSEGHGAGLVVDGETFFLQVPQEAAEIYRLCPGVYRSPWWVCDILNTDTLSTWEGAAHWLNALPWQWPCRSTLPLIQRPWPPAGRQTNHLTTRKSSSLPRSGNPLTRYASRKRSTDKYWRLRSAVVFSWSLHFLSLQVLLPLIDQTFKNHCLYFLSTPSKSLSSCGCASNKEKEMITR